MITYIFAIFAIGQALQMGNTYVALGRLPEDRQGQMEMLLLIHVAALCVMGTSVISGVVAASQLGGLDLGIKSQISECTLVLVCVASFLLLPWELCLYCLR